MITLHGRILKQTPDGITFETASRLERPPHHAPDQRIELRREDISELKRRDREGLDSVRLNSLPPELKR